MVVLAAYQTIHKSDLFWPLEYQTRPVSGSPLNCNWRQIIIIFQSTVPKVHYTPAKNGRITVCPFCNKSVAPIPGFSNVQSHLENNHGPETGFVCKICSPLNTAKALHVFVDLSAASEHLKEKHRNLSPATNSLLRETFIYPEDPRSFTCLKCAQIFLGQSFRTSGIMTHLRNAHGFDPDFRKLLGSESQDSKLTDLGVVAISCRRCDEHFQEESSLIIHGKICTG